jgi:hypothetical protein
LCGSEIRLIHAIIRARESPEEAEKDLLSSTSEKLREIWNGTQVVGQIGDLTTIHSVYHTWAGRESVVICSLHSAIEGGKGGLQMHITMIQNY